MEISARFLGFITAKTKHSPNALEKGFTLIEALVVVMILGILLVGLIMTFNPAGQFDKAKDAQREHDLEQIQRALDSYYNDTGCYPRSISFGVKWALNGQVFMEKIPQDPDCSKNGNYCYIYEVDASSTCPQWNVLYATLHAGFVPVSACALAKRSGCLPSGFNTNGYNYCALSGQVDCTYISGDTVGSSSNGSSGGSGGSGGGGGATPTPSGPPVCPNEQYYGCTGDNRCNSVFPKSQCAGYGGNITCFCDQHCNQSCAFN